MTERNISKATEVGIEYAAEQAFNLLAIYYLDREREVAFQSFLYLFVALRESDIGLAFFLVDTMLRGIGEERFATIIGTAIGDDVDKMDAAGVRSIQVHTGGECAMNATMTKTAILDLLFLENVGNLVCTAEEDVGSNLNIEILSLPEGDDKPLKYPLMFTVCDAVIISKIDTGKFFKFAFEALESRVHALNPESKIFFVSAKTGEGMQEWVDWLTERVEKARS